ncbi:hypothetical protein DB35_11875, partial [Streptomyces abyssalis]
MRRGAVGSSVATAGPEPVPATPHERAKDDPTMTRVIAGAVGGRRLTVPPGQGTRPTSDRAREGM